MIKHLQFVRGTTVQNNRYTGSDGEITIDTDDHSLRIHDGVTAGGHKVTGGDPVLANKVTQLEKNVLTKSEASTTYLGKTAKAESAKTADAVAWTAVTGKPSTFTPNAHNQASSTITAMTGYTKGGTASAIAATDSLNVAIGKLEKALDSKQAAGSYVTTSTAFTQTKADGLYLGKTAKAESAKTADAVAWTAVTGKPGSFTPSGHNQASSTINAMTGYSKAASVAAIATTDSLNTAIGKLEKALDSKQAAGSYVTTANAFTQSKADGLYLGKTAKAASATVADSATKATQDASGNVITTTYATKSELASVKSENNSKVAISGNRGQLAGMETPAAGTVVNGTSADSMTATGNVTVQTGATNTAWTKAVTISNASYTVSLGGSWHWVGGKVPEIKVPGILVCHWNSSVGLANYISGAA